MEKDYATRKREKWGNKHCNHVALDKETEQGKDTGHRACITCGLTMSASDWDNLRYGLPK